MPVQPDYEVTLAKAVELLKEIVETEAPGAAAADAILAKWAQLRPEESSSDAAKEGTRNALADGTRVLAHRLAGQAAQSGAALMQFAPAGKGPWIPGLLDTTLTLGRRKAVEPGLIFSVLEDLVEVCMVSDCESVFDWIEGHAEELGHPDMLARGKLIAVRTCNQLLRRLSKADGTRLCGRILLFLIRLVPLDDKSGLNPTGLTNKDHPVLLYDVQEGEKDTMGNPIDAAFYRRFWGLQAIFQDPAAGVSSVKASSTLVADIRAVLEEFRTRSIALTTEGTQSASSEVTVAHLTSPHLFGLQLRDSAFRRIFLLQCLFLLRGYQMPREPRDELKPKQMDDFKAVTEEVFRELSATPPHAKEFVAAVRDLLKREDVWMRWKNPPKPKNKEEKAAEGCATFHRAPLPPIEPPEAGQPTVPPLKRVRMGEGGAVSLGAPGLDELWNLWDDNLEGLSAESRGHSRGLTSLMQDVALQMDPDMGIPESSRLKSDGTFKWRAFRALNRTRQNVAGSVPAEALPIGGINPDLEDLVKYTYPDMLPESIRARVEEEKVERKRKFEKEKAAQADRANKGGKGPKETAKETAKEGGKEAVSKEAAKEVDKEGEGRAGSMREGSTKGA